MQGIILVIIMIILIDWYGNWIDKNGGGENEIFIYCKYNGLI